MGTSTMRFREYAFPRSRWDLAQSSARLYVIALVCLSVLAPPILISTALPWVRAEQLLLPVIFANYGWFLLAGFARPIRPNGMFLIGAIYTICVIFSAGYGYVVLQQRVILSDLYEIPKLWLPVIAEFLCTGALIRLFLRLGAVVGLRCIGQA